MLHVCSVCVWFIHSQGGLRESFSCGQSLVCDALVTRGRQVSQS